MKHAIVLIAALLVAAAPARAGQLEATGNTIVMRSRVPLESKQVKGGPYSADVENEHVQVLADGNRIVKRSTGRVYRDAEGRVRREDDRGTGVASISIVDPVAGVSYLLDPENHVAWRTPTPMILKKLDEVKALTEEQAVALTGATSKLAAVKSKLDALTFETTSGRVNVRRGDVAPEERRDEALDARTIEGVTAEGRRTTTIIPAGAIGNDLPIVSTSEQWTSPDLQVLVLSDRKDPRSGDSTYRLLNIRKGDPDPSLFQVPPDYTVRETGIRRQDVR
jgi:hypothetical protein